MAPVFRRRPARNVALRCPDSQARVGGRFGRKASLRSRSRMPDRRAKAGRTASGNRRAVVARRASGARQAWPVRVPQCRDGPGPVRMLTRRWAALDQVAGRLIVGRPVAGRLIVGRLVAGRLVADRRVAARLVRGARYPVRRDAPWTARAKARHR
ncbi:hypothetical protein OHA21_28760 [Actinoplanes sp. NBC_00393]|uniref:hypothetical protein n=1 Tax=Actinoplanes sp. NBC_00393 TaxID=2975953 RepID=UPI002E1D378E